jgi:hypothetical protein
MFGSTRPSSDALKFGGGAMPSSLLRSVFPYLSIMFLNEVDIVPPPMPHVMFLKCIIIIVLVFSLHGILLSCLLLM